MDRKVFVSGMAQLALNFGRELTPELVDLYWDHFGEWGDAEWETAVTRTVKSDDFFPPIAKLRRYGRPEASDDVVAVKNAGRAQQAYDWIIECYESGRHVGHRDLRERWGLAAADAFVAAGGVAAFEWCEPRNEPFRRKAFMDAFVTEGMADPSALEPVVGLLGSSAAHTRSGPLPLAEVVAAGLGFKHITGKGGSK